MLQRWKCNMIPKAGLKHQVNEVYPKSKTLARGFTKPKINKSKINNLLEEGLIPIIQLIEKSSEHPSSYHIKIRKAIPQYIPPGIAITSQ